MEEGHSHKTASAGKADLAERLIGKEVQIYLSEKAGGPQGVYRGAISGVESLAGELFVRFARYEPKTIFYFPNGRRTLETEDIYIRAKHISQIHPLKEK